MKDLINKLIILSTHESVVKPLRSVEFSQKYIVFGLYYSLQTAFHVVRLGLMDTDMEF